MLSDKPSKATKGNKFNFFFWFKLLDFLCYKIGIHSLLRCRKEAGGRLGSVKELFQTKGLAYAGLCLVWGWEVLLQEAHDGRPLPKARIINPINVLYGCCQGCPCHPQIWPYCRVLKRQYWVPRGVYFPRLPSLHQC